MFLCLGCYIPEGVDGTNFLISPVYAPDWVLKEMPPMIHVRSSAYDPLLDEYVN